MQKTNISRVLRLIILLSFICILSAQKKDYILIDYFSKEYKIPFNYTPVDQTIKERKIKNVKIKEEVSFGGENDTSIFLAIGVKPDKDGNIYVMDQTDSKVKKFSSKGKFIRSYGAKGSGPSELEYLYRFDVSKDGKTLLRLGSYDHKVCYHYNNEIKDNKLKMNGGEICLINDEYILFSYQGLNFIKYDRNGNELLTYKSPLNLEKNKHLKNFMTSVDGRIFPFGTDLIYIPLYYNHIVVYDDKGKIKFSRRTIDKQSNIPPIKIEKIKEFTAALAPDPEFYINYFAGINGDKIWIFSSPGTKKEKKEIIDFYSAKDGSYLYSYAVEGLKSISHLYLSGSKLYVIESHMKIKVYNIFNY